MSVNMMKSISEVFLLLGFLFSGVTAFLFFALDIGKAWGDVTGRRAHREALMIRKQSASLPSLSSRAARTGRDPA